MLWRQTPGNLLRLWSDRARAKLSLRTRLRALFSPKPAQTNRLGYPSRFSPGTWVRVLDEARIRETLDAQGKLRGLTWSSQLWPYCGTVHRVLKRVRRMMDDKATMRPISRTVLIDSVTCGGTTGFSGCGRQCPMMFRDQWLEEVPAPTAKDSLCAAHEGLYATVRDAEDIRMMLASSNSHHGLLFMPEMYQHAGKRFPVLAKVERVWGPGAYVPVDEGVYILGGVHCTGDAVGDDGPCDRGCRILWHEDWIRLEPQS